MPSPLPTPPLRSPPQARLRRLDVARDRAGWTEPRRRARRAAAAASSPAASLQHHLRLDPGRRAWGRLEGARGAESPEARLPRPSSQPSPPEASAWPGSAAVPLPDTLGRRNNPPAPPLLASWHSFVFPLLRLLQANTLSGEPSDACRGRLELSISAPRDAEPALTPLPGQRSPEAAFGRRRRQLPGALPRARCRP